MKRTLLLTSTLLALASPLFAEGKHGGANQGFLKAAAEYEQQANKAQANGNTHNADIFRKLAAIKREAAVAKGGYDWSHYYELRKELEQGKSHNKHVKHDKKHKPAGGGFNEAAERYTKLARQAEADGDSRRAKIYYRMAQIKRDAAASKGNFDWSEYHALEGQLHHAKGHEKKTGKQPVAKKHHASDKVDNGHQQSNYIAAAQKEAALANEANKNGDSYASQIHTRLAAILIDAAAKQSNGEEIDWTEFNELSAMLEKHLR